MCVAFLLWDCLPHHSLILAFNRDEHLHRETLSAHFWTDKQGVIGGRDCSRLGSWLVCNVNGRIALLTNVHSTSVMERLTSLSGATPSRGDLPVAFVESTQSPTEFIAKLNRTKDDYPGFNLIVIDLSVPDIDKQAHYVTNRASPSNETTTDADAKAARPISSGIHGVSNASLNTPWPKVTVGKRKLQDLVNSGAFRGPECPFEDIFALMSDATRLCNEDQRDLPRSCYGAAFDAATSGIFVRPVKYDGCTVGTRSMTVLAIRKDGTAELRERYMPSNNAEDAWAEERRRFTMHVHESA